MGWFKKKSDPITERARALNEQIANLEAQIRELNAHPADPDVSGKLAEAAPEIEELPPPAPAPAPKHPGPGPTARLRSTAFPLGPNIPTPSEPYPTAANKGPVFDSVQKNPFRSGHEREAPPPKELDVRKSDLPNTWRRFKKHFRWPATSNPKLVNYLAAGSIQGLRPLRYEKRVARNRFILLLACLILVLWGIIAVVVHR